MNKSLTTLTLIAMALASLVTFGLTGRYSASATATTTTQSMTMPKTSVYGLSADNNIYIFNPGSTTFSKVGRVNVPENLLGMDFRTRDNGLYAFGDKGGLYLINLASGLGATKISQMSPQFAGGLQSLMDFNPVVDAIRIVGSNDQNFAIVNGAGNLATTASQATFAYAAGDVNAGINPEIVGGGYTNAFVGATNTIFYLVDHVRDQLLTVAAPLTATGSSNTGGGQAATIGSVLDSNGSPINFHPLTDFDVYYDPNTATNTIIGVSGQMLFAIPVNAIPQNLALGQTQNVKAVTVTLPALSANNNTFIDISVMPAAAGPAPTPTPTPAPKPTATPTPANGARCTVSYNVTGQWDTGFNTVVNLKNLTGADLNSWQFSFTFTGNQTISSLYNGTVLQAGRSVKVGNANFNRLFANGGTVQFGFTAAYSGFNPTPIGFALNGIPCTR